MRGVSSSISGRAETGSNRIKRSSSSPFLLRCLADSIQDDAALALKLKYSAHLSHSSSPDSILANSNRSSRGKASKAAVTLNPLPPLSEEVSVRQRLRIFMDYNLLPTERSTSPQPPSMRRNKMKDKESSSRRIRAIESSGLPAVDMASVNPASIPSDDDFINSITSLRSTASNANSLYSNVARALEGQSADRPVDPPPLPLSLRNMDPPKQPLSPHQDKSRRLPSMSAARWRDIPESARRSLRIQSPHYLIGLKRGYSSKLDDLMIEKERNRRQQVSSEGEAGPDCASDMEEKLMQVAEQVSRFLGASLPDKALLGWRAEQLSSLLDLKEEEAEQSRTKLEEACGLWMDVCGPDFARQFIEKEPTLLLCHPKDLLLALECFSQAFDLPPNECVAFSMKNIALINMSKEKIQSTIHEVMSLLDLSEQDSRQLVMKHTELITSEEGSRGESLRERFQVLKLLLPVTQAKLIQILNRRPMLLTHSVIKHALMISDLSRILSMPLFNAAVVAAAEPNLLCMSKRKVEARWSRLVELTGPHSEWKEQLKSYSPFQLARCLCASDSAIERLATVSRLGILGSKRAWDIKRILCMTEGRFLELFPAAAAEASRIVESGVRVSIHVEGFETKGKTTLSEVLQQ